jgi:hypothetical protein
MNVKDNDKEYMMQVKIRALGFLNQQEPSKDDIDRAISSIVTNICNYPAFDKSKSDELKEMGELIKCNYQCIDDIREFVIGFNFI